MLILIFLLMLFAMFKETKNPKYNQPESKDELNHVITMKDLAKSYVHSSDLQMERGIL
jgi:hypothetical protein